MAEAIIIIICLGAVIIYLGWKIKRLKKDVYTFAGQLEEYLDNMAAGREQPVYDEQSETLWSKIHEKLNRIWHIQNQKEAENAEEKRKLEELISDISHQTRTPIANIKMYQEFLQNEPELTDQGQEFLKKMEGQIEKLDFLLKSMVKISRLETGIIKIRRKKEPLHKTLSHAIAAVVPKAAAKSIEIYVDCDEKTELVHDPKWTEEAVFNILDNAVKYTSPEGKVHIGVQVQEIFTKISIKDTGRGIALERQAEIFSRFYREPEVHAEEGIGVGLYLAREIVTLQGGYIEVHSKPGKGAEFCLYLPNK